VFLGIIDILQNYRLAKKIEHVLKATIHDGVRLALNNFFWKRANGLTLHL
jgi:1-phosphatidylinositol-4-phosphate 5-kinase